MFPHGEINFEVIPALAVPKGKVNKETLWHYREPSQKVRLGRMFPENKYRTSKAGRQIGFDSWPG